MSLKIPKRIKDISLLRPAQHVYLHKRRFGLFHYNHHGIILSVDPEQQHFDMLHYVKPGLFQTITLVRGKIDYVKYSQKGIFLVNYGEGDCLQDEQVLEKAQECIGRQDFNLFWRTSENIARFCKTGSYEGKGDPVIRYENFTGVLYDHPRLKVESITQLAAGDHLVFLRYKILYEHHAIIINIDQNEKKMTLVHFQKKANKVLVIEETIDYLTEKSPLFKVYYEDDEALSAWKVVEIAKKLLAMGGYHIFRRNCEHFAFLCKTSAEFSEQIRATTTWAVTSGMNMGLSTLLGTTLIGLCFIIARISKHTLKILKQGAIGITTAAEAAIASWEIFKASRVYQKGKISLKVFRAKIVTILASLSLTVAGAVGGSVLGAMVANAPGAVIGALIGAIVCGRIPQVISNIVNGIAQNRQTNIGSGATTREESDLRTPEEIPVLQEEETTTNLHEDEIEGSEYQLKEFERSFESALRKRIHKDKKLARRIRELTSLSL